MPERSRERQIEELREQERRLQAQEWQALRGSNDPHVSIGLGKTEFGAEALAALLNALIDKST